MLFLSLLVLRPVSTIIFYPKKKTALAADNAVAKGSCLLQSDFGIAFWASGATARNSKDKVCKSAKLVARF